MTTQTQIDVAIRIRPLSELEKIQNQKNTKLKIDLQNKEIK